MSETVGEAVVELRGDGTRLGPDMEREGRAGGSRFGGAFSGALKGFVLGAAVTAVGGFLKTAIDGASDLGETVSKTGVVFGKAGDDIVKFASQGATVLGQSKQAALDAAATFGVFGKAAGLTGRDLSSFSTDLVSLSTDLASFHNAEPEEVVEALGAALRGESEPMRRFGVLLDDASLRAEALKQGLIATTKQALTPQQKTLAAQALIMRQTADAQGDFARTSDGLANKQRIAAASFEDLRTRLGGAFLPAATAAADGLVKILDAADGIGPALAPIKSALSGVFSGIDLSGVQSAVQGALGGIASSLGPALSSLLPGLQSFASSLASSLGPALQAVGGFIQGLLPTVSKFAAQIAGVVGPALSSIGNLIKTQLVPAFQAVLPVILPVAKFLLTIFGSAVVGAIKGVVKVISGLITFISGVFNIIAALFTGDWPRLWQGLKQVVSGALQAILGVIQVILNVGILGLFRKGIAAVRAIWTGLWSGLKSIVSSAGGAVQGAFSSVLNGILGIVRGVLSGVVGFFRGSLSTAVGIVRNGMAVARSAFGGAMAAIRTVVQQGISRVIGFFRSLGGQIIGATRSAFTGVVGAVRGGIDSAVGLVRNIGSRMAGFIRGAAGALSNAGRELIGGLVRGIASRIDEAVQKVRDGLALIKRLLPGSPIKDGPLKSWNNGGAGKRLMGMLADGLSDTRAIDSAMTSQARRIDDRMRRISAGAGPSATWVDDPFPATADAAGGVTPAGAGGGRNATINVSLPTGDPQAAAAAVMSAWVMGRSE